MSFEHEKNDYLKIVLQIKFGKIRPGQIIAAGSIITTNHAPSTISYHSKMWYFLRCG